MTMILGDYFELESCMCGHHIYIYKDIWTTVVNEELSCRRNKGKYFGPINCNYYHIWHHCRPSRISAACNLFIQGGGAVMSTALLQSVVEENVLVRGG